MKLTTLLFALLIGALVSFIAGAAAPTLAGTTAGYIVVFGLSSAAAASVLGRLQRQSATASPAAPPACRQRSTSMPAAAAETSHPAALPAAPEEAGRRQRIDIQTALQADSSVLLTLTISGYSGAEFKKRIRPRLANIAGIKWKHPVNLGEGTRKLEGTILPGVRADLALSAVRRVA